MNKRGQIWVETVIYTLIAFALIGLVLAFVKPKIEEIQDESLIKQSIEVLEEIDLVVRTLGGVGNQRVIELGISKGTLNIDGENDRVFFEIESKSEYSQPGEDVTIGNIVANTQKAGDLNDVTLTRDFSSNYDITYDGSNSLGELGRASIPHRILITDKGDSSGKTLVNIEVIT